ncbi:probable carboxylesterase 15 [Triticum dicoccoides]|uniref:probable carboxylesterase 15 n=1 Tax=Triticum dicoccoides TaxID=85692 RepID=UPI00188F09DE|nr:probable carboxylesterase 15 [Triticum dicoccoides]
MAGDTAPHVVEDLLGIVQLLSDGSVVRGDESVLGPKEPLPDVPGVEWKDVVYHAAHGLRVRVYRPASASSLAGSVKLPVLVYFHGGGYCLGSFSLPTFHAFCLRAAAELPAVVLSVQYRLAPEHRLPAAIDDGAQFLSWLRGQAELGTGGDPWLAASADFARTFISGVSAGANLAHHLTVQVATARLPVSPVRVVGYVLLSAFFGGAERTASEADQQTGVTLPVEIYEPLWHMSLPVGATRDHPVANPFGPESPSLAPVELPPALVVAPLGDVLRDRVLGYAARLKDMGKDVELVEFEGQQHGFSVLQPFAEAADELMRVLGRFVYQRDTPAER